MSGTEPMDKLKDAGRNALGALGKKAMGTVTDKVGGLTDKLEDIAGGGPVGKAVAEGGKAKAEGDSAVGGALKGAVSGVKDKITGGGGSSSGGGKPTKSTNIIESIDVGVPVKVAYNQWTEFSSFPSFMKKVESVDAPDENKLEFKAQIFLSHRSWEATIHQQRPDECIVWRSKGQKGHVDGAVTFHELGPNLTRILVVLEYYPKGLFEKTGNIWEAQGRRARAEIRHFRRHVMTRTLLEPDEVEGWRGTIEDGEVVESHEDAVDREEQEQEQEQSEDEAAEQEESDGDYDDSEEPEGDYEEGEEPAEDEPEEEYEEGEEPAEDEPEDEYEEGEEPAEDEPEDEYEEGEEPAEDEPEDEYEEGEEPEEEYEEGEEPAEDEYAAEESEDDAASEDEAEEPPRRRKRRAS